MTSLAHIAEQLRSAALDIGPAATELLFVVGLINATRLRLEREAKGRLLVERGLAELAQAPGLDLRVKHALTGAA